MASIVNSGWSARPWRTATERRANAPANAAASMSTRGLRADVSIHRQVRPAPGVFSEAVDTATHPVLGRRSAALRRELAVEPGA